MVEVADVCDVVKAPNLADKLRAMLKLRIDSRDVPVIETVATSGAGVEAFAMAIEAPPAPYAARAAPDRANGHPAHSRPDSRPT